MNRRAPGAKCMVACAHQGSKHACLPPLTANMMVLRALKTLSARCAGGSPTKGVYTVSAGGLYMAASTVAMVQ